MTTALLSDDYRQAVEALCNDRVVRDMAVGLRQVPTESIAWENGSPRGDFMVAAMREYERRTGHPPKGHIGATGEALLKLRELGVDTLKGSTEPVKL